MARSYRRYPVIGFRTTFVARFARRYYHKSIRSLTRGALRHRDTLMPLYAEGRIKGWWFSKQGGYMADSYKEEEWYQQMLRK